MPEVSQSFEIDQPVERVWAFLQDVPQVVTCMPGLELVGRTGPATYQGRVTVRLGPIAAAFEGEATIVAADAAARRARIEAKGIDRKGGSRATASVGYELAPADAGTRVSLAGEVKLTGTLAQIGRTGIIQDVAAELTREFAAALRARLAAAPVPEAAAPARAAGAPPVEAAAAPAAVSGTRLVLAVLWRRLRRAVGALFGRVRPVARQGRPPPTSPPRR